MAKQRPFKSILLSLATTHLVTLIGSLIFGAGLQTLLIVYILQSLVVLLVVSYTEFLGAYTTEKISILFRLLIFMTFILPSLFFVRLVAEKGIVYVNDVPQAIHMGKLSAYAVVIGTLGFIADYWRSQRGFKSNAKHGSDPFAFFKIFTRIASMILIITVAFSFKSSALALSLVTVIKFVLDVGQEWFERLSVSFSKELSGKR